MIRDLLAEALRRRGIRVEAFADAAAAEARHVTERFGIVFVDISVKGTEGGRYIEELKNRNDVDIVCLVGEAVDPDELRRLEDGALSTLRKPFGLDEINAVCDVVAPPGAAAPPTTRAA
jgi:DNA-binding response OmpR family regulator